MLKLDHIQQSVDRVEAALRQVTGTPFEELEKRGIELVPADLSIGRVSVRGRLELDSKRVLYDPRALQDLGRAMDWADLPGEPLELMLAHELFHLLDPGCPSHLAEGAAHMFATRLLGLPYYLGTLDTVEREYRRR